MSSTGLVEVVASKREEVEDTWDPDVFLGEERLLGPVADISDALKKRYKKLSIILFLFIIFYEYDWSIWQRNNQGSV